MSVHRYSTGDGDRYRVRWRDHGGKLRSKTFRSEEKAGNFDEEISRRKRDLEALPPPTTWTLDYAWGKWLDLEGPERALSTVENYKALWRAHIAGGFGSNRLSTLVADPMLFDEFNASLRNRAVGASSRRKLMMIISGVLSSCVYWKKISHNPLHGRNRGKKRTGRGKDSPPLRTVRVFSPLLVERIRREMRQRDVSGGPSWRAEADAVLVGLMAYAGLRPQEALALKFDHIASKRLAVNFALTTALVKTPDGEVERRWQPGPPKTGEGRNPPLIPELKADLNSLRAAMGDPPPTSFVFPGPDGGPWRQSAYSNWRRRVWRPAVEKVAASDESLGWVASARPYDCRRSFVSLQLMAGVQPLKIAKDAGHSKQVLFDHYASLIEDLADEKAVDPAKLIRNARELVYERSEVRLKEITEDSLKPPGQIPEDRRNLLYGPRSAAGASPSRERG